MIEHQLSDPLVVQLNNYLDELLQTSDSESAAKDLVGQIHQGQQLIMDFTKPELASFKKITEDLAVAYINILLNTPGRWSNPNASTWISFGRYTVMLGTTIPFTII